MRIIKAPFLTKAAKQFPQAAFWLAAFRKAVQAARWRNLADVRRVYASADAVKVESGRTVTVFNVAGNKYRLITAVHYNMQTLFTLRFLTHAEYSKNQWKNDL